jgi:hypothetical protein
MAVGITLLLAAAPVRAKERPPQSREALHLAAGQKEFLRLEPVLVTVRLEGRRSQGLPAAPGASKLGTLRFEVAPTVKPRQGAKPLPLEAQAAGPVQVRHFDLLEWFAFPDQGGTWSVRAVFEHQGTKLTSAPLTVMVRPPGKGDAEAGPVARLHHTPWSNYDTNAFCGDTFDVVKQWPTSRMARYCHYWNGRYLQYKKEYDKAIASYRLAAEQYPGFALADDAAYGIVECLYAQKKLREAQTRNTELRQSLQKRATKGGNKPGAGQPAVQGLAQAMADRLRRDSRRQ